MTVIPLTAQFSETEAERLRALAARRNETLADFVADAVSVFADMPEELRKALLKLRAEPALFNAVEEMSMRIARRNLDFAAERLARSGALPKVAEDATDLEVLDMASGLLRGR
jgi:hypothetical protein